MNKISHIKGHSFQTAGIFMVVYMNVIFHLWFLLSLYLS